MVASNLPSAGSSGNLGTITDIECDAIKVTAHLVLNAIELVVVGPDGSSFRTLVGRDIASDFALRVATAAADLLDPSASAATTGTGRAELLGQPPALVFRRVEPAAPVDALTHRPSWSRRCVYAVKY